MRRLVLLTAAAVLSLLAPVVVAGAASAAGSGSTASMESDFVSRLNALRASKGLAPLTVDGELTGIARRWAGKMASEGQISHNPNFPNEVKQNWVKLGENVGTGPDVKSIHDAFVASQTHYKNMIDPAFTRIGVGVVTGPNGAIYTAHQFMRLASDDAPAVGSGSGSGAGAAPAASKPAARPAARPAASTARKPAAAKPAAAPAAAPKPVVVPVRIALSLEQSQGRGL